MNNENTGLKLRRNGTHCLLLSWNPEPLTAPVLDPDVLNRPALERASAILIYSLLKLEFALSRDGVLREWARLWLRLSLVLLIPALLVLPVLVFTVNRIAEIATAVSLVVSTLLHIVINLVTMAAIVATVIAVIFIVIKKRRQPQYSQHTQHKQWENQ